MKQNTLLLLLAVVLLGATFASQYVLITYSPSGIVQVTGAPATDTGTVTLTLQSTGSVRFAVSTLNFGTGKVNTTAGNTECILDSNGTNDSSKCINFTRLFGNLSLENDGSTNVTVQLVSDVAAAAFFGGNPSFARFRWNTILNETGSCRNGTGGNGSVTWDDSTGLKCTSAVDVAGNCTVNPMNWTDVNVTSPGTTICGMFMPEEANDSIGIEINISIPFDAPAGVKTATLTATATSN
ncbi:hypothetical protein HY492_00105 [Candidatus Woesearchaeota archaeon]|nr:hypothetical protein [Candidatus Woesearchaeota archaeon]